MRNQANEFERSNLSLVDDVGTLFVSEGRVLRAINESAASDAVELLDSGLIAELVAKRLFPATAVVDDVMPGYALVLEHQKISPLIFPFEWSPEMLRSAALCVLEVNKIAARYGYELKDAHPYNLLFDGSRPVYLDFGSFVKKSSDLSWVAYDEFLSAYYYPLKARKKGYEKLFKQLYLTGGVALGSGELASIVHPVFRFTTPEFSRKWFKRLKRYRLGPTALRSDQEPGRRRTVRQRLAEVFYGSSRLPFKKTKLDSLCRKIQAMDLSSQSTWAAYHESSGFYADSGAVELPPRMLWIAERVEHLAPRSVLELAGNQGVLSRSLTELNGIERVICTDYDENSIDQLFLKSAADERISMACFDFMGDVWQRLGAERAGRLRSELVIALAVTHHLILTQNYSLAQIVETLADYSSRFLIVEFMPLGLWNGKSAKPLPDWYKESWFEAGLKERFSILEKQQLEDNRIAYVAELQVAK